MSSKTTQESKPLRKIILDLCGGTGSWSKPYADHPEEYEVIIVTLPEYDVLTYEPPENVYGILAAPPCTMFSTMRTTGKTPRDLKGGMELVNACLRIIHTCLYKKIYKNTNGSLKFWALENPATGYLKKFLGYPPLVFQPYEYGDPYTKRTAIWGYYNIPKKLKKPVEILTPKNCPFLYYVPSAINKDNFCDLSHQLAFLKQTPAGYKEKTKYSDQQIIRSIVPYSFANAFYKANR